MNLFTWLVVGHLVGDWMLQNDWMGRGKQRNFFTLEIFVHCLTYTATLAGALWLATNHSSTPPPYLTLLTCIFLSHWVIDAGDLANHWLRFWRQSRLSFVRMMVDQTMHLVVLAVLAEWWV